MTLTFERNISMLEKELEQKDYSPWIEYHIASEYYRVKQYSCLLQNRNGANCKIKILQ
ncbi:hypothetical protein [Bacillus methanolicus]|uniref:hypothetical protein n=1 Tax=Bacillus methanolicus TaxID=1471 RepID=UPI00238047A2|nr:hypothetical protein [Bacillus methanolicus]